MTTRMRENRGLRQVRTAVYSAVILAGIVVVALIGRLLTSSGPREGSSTVLAQSRPESPPYRPYIARFEEAWMRGDRTAIMSFFPELVREYQHKRFQKRLDQRGIDEDLPELTDYNEILIPRDNPQKVKAYWSIPSARIRTEWHHEDGKWVLTRLGFGRPR